MRTSLVALLIAFVAAAAFPSTILVQPIAPDTHSFVTITLGGAWPDACVPVAIDTQFTGKTISITALQGVTPFAGCLPFATLWRQTANLGLLAPGTYLVNAFVEVNGRTVSAGSTQFTVRPAEPFRAVPPGAPVAGGTEIRLVSPNNWPANQVVFGDSAPVTATVSGNVLYVTAPAHAAGTVDLKVGTQVATSAFTFYDSAAPPDNSIFEPVLFPIAITGPGAFGASWVTDNTISAPPAQAATLFESGEIASLVRVDAMDPAGVLVHAGRGTLDAAAMSSRIRDLSRQAQTAGTEIPIVRERDWKLRTVRLTNIPSDGKSRITLRIWEDHDRPSTVSVETSVKNRAQFASIDQAFTRQANGLLFAQVDITDLVSRIPSTDPRDLKIEAQLFDPDIRLWALVTITNNDTQQVTAIWPQ